MFAPSQEAGEDAQWTDAWEVVEISWESDNEQVEENLILPEVDPENPENTQAPIVTEEGEINEMDQMVELQLENWETEIVRQWDLWDAIQIN